MLRKIMSLINNRTIYSCQDCYGRSHRKYG